MQRNVVIIVNVEGGLSAISGMSSGRQCPECSLIYAFVAR